MAVTIDEVEHFMPALELRQPDLPLPVELLNRYPDRHPAPTIVLKPNFPWLLLFALHLCFYLIFCYSVYEDKVESVYLLYSSVFVIIVRCSWLMMI